MKKIMMLVAAVCATLNMNADILDTDQFNAVNVVDLNNSVDELSKTVVDSIVHLNPDSSRVAMKRNRFLLDDEQSKFRSSAPTSSEWGANWFVGAQAGASVYVGKPLGCADAFDRISPNIHVYAGKWFTPAVGARISYQGYSIKDCRLDNMSIQSYHADLMYNIMSYRYNRANDQRFDLVPFAGCGLIHNSDLHRSDFSLNYGIQAKYHLNDRLHLTAEASGLTTFQQFDGHGASDRLGDHKFDVSLGLAVNIGKVGFRKAKSQPIAYKVLDNTNKSLKNDKEDKLKSEHQKSISWSTSSAKRQPINNYSGLNSLRARLAEAGQTSNNNANTQTDSSISAVCHCGHNATCQCSDCSDKCATVGNCGQQHTKNESTKRALVNGSDTLGLTIPYICYFKINTHNLTNNSQLEYLSEIVKLAKERNMAIRVIGAADSATGTASLNQRLSEDRADYISDQLMALGMSSGHIELQALGGIEEFTPIANNRYCKIQLIPLSTSA